LNNKKDSDSNIKEDNEEDEQNENENLDSPDDSSYKENNAEYDSDSNDDIGSMKNTEMVNKGQKSIDDIYLLERPVQTGDISICAYMYRVTSHK
jgi:hypothetical protein